MKLFPLILILLVSCVAAYGFARWFTALAQGWALKHNIVSQVTHRSSHTIPTARLGGVGLALGFGLATFLFLICINRFNTWSFQMLFVPYNIIIWIGAGWLLIFIVGLLDDIYDLRPMLKLGLLIVAVLIPTFGCGIVFNIFPYFLIDVGLSVFWLLFFINGFNFMDGMDGFAAGFARLASIFFFALACAILWKSLNTSGISGILLTLPLLLILASACCGFLHWNNPPAKVFMGDGGSLSLGYLLAIYVVLNNISIGMTSHEPFSFTGMSRITIPILSSFTVLLPFIFDVVLTLIRRARRGENLLKAHREHLYQRLMKTGLSHGEVLRIAKRTFWACGLLALVGALTGNAVGRWGAFVLALVVMDYYWLFTLARERNQKKLLE